MKDESGGWVVVERRPDGSYCVVSWGLQRHVVAGELRVHPGLPWARAAARRAVRCTASLGAAAREARELGQIEVTVRADGVAELAAPPVVNPPPGGAAALRAPVPLEAFDDELAAVAGGMAAGAGHRRHGSGRAEAWGGGGAFRDGAGGMAVGGACHSAREEGGR